MGITVAEAVAMQRLILALAGEALDHVAKAKDLSTTKEQIHSLTQHLIEKFWDRDFGDPARIVHAGDAASKMVNLMAPTALLIQALKTSGYTKDQALERAADALEDLGGRPNVKPNLL